MADSQQNTVWTILKNFSNKFSMPDFVNGNDKRGRKHISYDRISGSDDKSDFLSSSNPHLLDIVGKDISELEPDASDTSFHSNLNVTPNPSVSNAKLTPSQTTPSLSSVASVKSKPISNLSGDKPPSSRLGSISSSLFKGGGRSVDFNLKTKKFVFPNRVPSYQADQDKDSCAKRQNPGGTHITENVKDGNWLEIEDDDDSEDDDDGKGGDYDGASSCTSDYEDDEEEETRNGTRCGICGCEKKYEDGVKLK